MHCSLSASNLCRSCPLSSLSYDQQIEKKDQGLRSLLAPCQPQHWLEPVRSATQGYRNKAKMVVLGAAHEPCLGAVAVVDEDNKPISLRACPLYPQDMQDLLAALEQWIRTSGIPPYNVNKKKGELKFILLTRSHKAGEFMVRFVLRSHNAMPRIEANLERLMTAFPAIKVVSVNIQPVHMARLEGDEEIFLTQAQHLDEQLNDVPLVIRPKSFFQTNPDVAAKLYTTARQWVREIKPSAMWDLFCGVGGFALHCVSPETDVTGIEIEPEAIASAQRSAQAMGITNLDFAALDSTGFSMEHDTAPELVLVNPPRRGIGEQLCQQLSHFAPKHIIYSSCNPETLAIDIQRLEGYELEKVQWFDMFPHTDHAEVLVLLSHKE
ncbi:23S rRNA (uracil(747)-C(5))-methyltransferase RlmC [Photobacterium damselae]|nr:23S rRNA (uracil(747)-C(5))-methyltransferase RlmC [Photobacterium damselae]